MDIIQNITYEDFQTYFPREFNYLVIWNETSNYKLNQNVYYNDYFYSSLINNNVNNNPQEDTTNQYWTINNSLNYNEFINENDFNKAYQQAINMINVNLFRNKPDLLRICFLLLTAHFLVIDLNMSNGNGASAWMMTSKSVGSVSASYGIPQKILENPLYSYLASTSFGLKYLQYLLPLITGFNVCIAGTTTLR